MVDNRFWVVWFCPARNVPPSAIEPCLVLVACIWSSAMPIGLRLPNLSLFFGQRVDNSVSRLLDCARVIFLEIVMSDTAIIFLSLSARIGNRGNR